MKFELENAIAVLSRTPATLTALLHDLPAGWTSGNEGPNTWRPYDVVRHLIHGERTDWMTRARIILDHGQDRPFDSFDRFAQFDESKGKKLEEMIEEFSNLRAENVQRLRAMNLSTADLDKTGQHPELGAVTLRELLATWVAHDLDHIAQIARTMAKQYGSEVGPWEAYLSVLHERDRG